MLLCVWALRQCWDNLKCVCVMVCFRALALSRDIWHIWDWSWSSLWTLEGRGAWCRRNPEVTRGLVLSHSSKGGGGCHGFFLSLNRLSGISLKYNSTINVTSTFRFLTVVICNTETLKPSFVSLARGQGKTWFLQHPVFSPDLVWGVVPVVASLLWASSWNLPANPPVSS